VKVHALLPKSFGVATRRVRSDAATGRLTATRASSAHCPTWFQTAGQPTRKGFADARYI
jgi:hypothetical protein